MLCGGENICGWLFMMEPSGIIAQGNDKAYLSQRQDAAAETQTAEPLVIPTLTVCLFSFVVGEHKMKYSNFENFEQKTRHKY